MSVTSGRDALLRRLQAPRGGPAGDSASKESVSRLRGELSSLKAAKAALPHLKRALSHIAAKDYSAARDAAEKALGRDPGLIHAWHLLAIAREHLGDWPAALEAYERGLALDPANPPIANDLGRLAFKMEMLPQAEALFRHYLAFRPHAPESTNNLACVLRSQMRYDEAIELLKPALQAHPDKVMLWNTLGTVMEDMGETEQAGLFYGEALRLDPGQVRARYNLANALFANGQHQEAIALCREAMAGCKSPEDLTMMRFALATMLLATGEIGQGWDTYAARLEPTYYDPVDFAVPCPRWEPGMDIEGKRLLLIGEQGLGDEVLFANTLDDVQRALGPGGRLTLAVTDRLRTLFTRSYPRAEVGTHVSVKSQGRTVRRTPFIEDWSQIDLWAPLGEALRVFRRSIDAYPHRPQGFMTADPARVRHWQSVLDGLPGQKVGLLWTSMVIDSTRHRHFAPFEKWEPVLRTPGVSFVNLQYGDQSASIERARCEFGVEIHQPPGIDLKNDLDDVAALACALDLTVGFSNASFNLAAACGAPCWLLTSSDNWARLGADHYAWYSQVRMLWPPAAGDWDTLMGDLSAALAEHVDATGRPAAARARG
nr:tetratricopeptide repeat-containing glycosyltransferase family protein [Phenylobacterium sp.]